MSGGFSFSELDFGTLNRFKEGVGNDGDPRRDNSLQLLNRALEETYGPQSLDSVEVFQGIVVGKRQVNRAAFQKKGSLLLQLAQGKTGGSDTVALNAPYFIYKVYIPELESRPRPLSGTDPVIQTYTDVYVSVDMELKYGELPMGGLVYVKYADKENLLDPMIVGYDGNVAIEWSDASTLTRKTYKSNSKKEGATKKLPKGCEMFLASKKGNPHNALAIGASYTRWWNGYASDHNLKMDRFSSSGKTISYIKKQFLAAFEDGECFNNKSYDYVFFFVGPNSLASNGNGSTPYSQLKGLASTVKSKFPGIKTGVITIQGWGGWGFKRGWITTDWSEPGGYKLTKGGRGIISGTKEYNRLIKAGGAFDYVVDWAPTGTVDYTSDDPQKFVLKPKYDADLIHPNGAAHKIIAGMVKTKMGW